MKYDTVVGLEIHIQLNTNTKAFCGDALTFGNQPNQHTSPISLAHPGTLPVINHKQISKAVLLGLALGCDINRVNFFDRKHYFYPDLPKGYQVTQDNQPICLGGSLKIRTNGQDKVVRIHHIHMEEDAGKTTHDQSTKFSLVDLNRAGTPLLELVTEPDLSNGEEVYQFITELQKIVRYLDVSDADMEKGSMRCDCNVSVKPVGSKVLGERCEIKNLNSRRFARQAVEYEAKRQIKLVEQGITFSKQTLHFNVEQKITQKLREKEGAEDYRYFPDPDLAPIHLDQDYINNLLETMPPLPQQVKEELMSQYGLIEDHADQISQDREIVRLFRDLLSKENDVKAIRSLIINQILPTIQTDEGLNFENLPAHKQLIDYLHLVKSGQVVASVAHQRLWPALVAKPHSSVDELADNLGIIINQDTGFLSQMVEEVLASNPSQVNDYRAGKKNLMGYFVGAVMRKAKGGLNPKEVQKIIADKLNN